MVILCDFWDGLSHVFPHFAVYLSSLCWAPGVSQRAYCQRTGQIESWRSLQVEHSHIFQDVTSHYITIYITISIATSCEIMRFQ